MRILFAIVLLVVVGVGLWFLFWDSGSSQDEVASKSAVEPKIAQNNSTAPAKIPENENRSASSEEKK